MRFWQVSLTILIAAPFAGVAVARLQRPSAYEWMRRATVAEKVGKIDVAESALRRAVARDENNYVARVRLARLALERSDVVTAAAAAHPIPDDHAVALTARLIESDAWFQMNRLVPTESCWLRAYELNPEHPAVCAGLAQLYGIQLRKEQWRKILWETYDRGNAGLDEMLQLTMAGLELRNFTGNLAKLRAAVAADPVDRNTRRALAVHQARSGQLEQARQDLTAMLQDSPDDLQTWFALAECHATAADANSLGELLDRAPALAQSDDRSWQILAAQALLQNRPNDAIQYYGRALEEYPYAAHVHVGITEALRMVGQSARAHLEVTRETAWIEQIIPTLHTNGWDLDLISQLIRSCEKLLLVEEAIGWVRVGVAKEPDNAFLQEANNRLRSLPRTSSRNPPAWESLAQRLSW